MLHFPIFSIKNYKSDGALVHQSASRKMTTLNIASKANQAATFPALLVAAFARELNPNSNILIEFAESDSLENANKGIIELTSSSGQNAIGPGEVLSKLVDDQPLLQGKDRTHVRVGCISRR